MYHIGENTKLLTTKVIISGSHVNDVSGLWASLKLHGPSMLPVKAKFVVCSIKSLALSFWMKHLVIGQLQKPAKFSAFHWSTSRSQAFIGQLLVTSRVVHLPKRTVMVLLSRLRSRSETYVLLFRRRRRRRKLFCV